MKGILGRAACGTILPIALSSIGLLVLAAPPFSEGALVAALALVAACLLCLIVLVPLRSDLNLIAAIVDTQTPQESQVVDARARTLEAAALLEGLALLRARFLELAPEVAAARKKVEDAELLRVRFVAAMGHDLRGPLNAIIGFSDLLVMEGQGAVAAGQRQSVELIRRSAADLLLLLEQILDWAKLEAGQIELQREPVLLADAVVTAAREAERRSADRGLSVELDVAGELRALADRARLVQALLGLLDHATRSAGSPKVKVRAQKIGPSDGGPARARIEVHDPQLVIREVDQAAFFEAFRPSYAPSGRRVAGLGLGPALARALIRAHGGEVSFSSKPDTGTTFHFELPLD